MDSWIATLKRMVDVHDYVSHDMEVQEVQIAIEQIITEVERRKALPVPCIAEDCKELSINGRLCQRHWDQYLFDNAK